MKRARYFMLCLFLLPSDNAVNPQVDREWGGDVEKSLPGILGKMSFLRQLLLVLAKTARHIHTAVCHLQRRIVCSKAVNCAQGIAHYPDGCCSCVCRKNYAKINETLCVAAAWAKWGSWSKCLKTGWGGLQTKTRLCVSEGVEVPGSCDGRGSLSRTCSEVSTEFKIRKNINDLTDEEVHDLIQAMTKFKKDPTKKGFRNIVSWHGWPFRCPWNHHITHHQNNHCSFHHHPLFLPWHRMITIQLEIGLSRYMKNKTLGIPFWDWTEHRNDIPYLIRNPYVYDPVLKTNIRNPFFNAYIKTLNGQRIRTQRHPWYPGLLMDKYLLKGTVRALLSHSYYSYDEQQSENPHDQIHNCFCFGKKKIFGSLICEYSMWSTAYAAWDPAFLLHHSAIDRLFVMRRKLEDLEGVSDWTKGRVISAYLTLSGSHSIDIKEAFDWPLSPFCNKSMNPEPVTRKDGVWIMRNAYYDNQLFGYKYSDFNLGQNYTWEDLRADFAKNVKNKDYWNDEYLETKIGPLTKKNSYSLKKKLNCAVKYYDPKWNMTIIWK